MRIDDYLDRIGFTGPVAADLACLRDVHRHHALSIPYENIDVQLGRRVDLDIDRIYDKLVTCGRGGWCYEMNGLLGWALAEIGFDVTRMIGGVPGAQDESVDPMGNHLVLRVELDQPWLADVGLGGAMLEPIPLREGQHRQGARMFELTPLSNDVWRFDNDPVLRPPHFEFIVDPNEARLAIACQSLQDDDQSLFRQNLICLRFDKSEPAVVCIFGRVLLRPGRDSYVIADADELVTVLGREFDLYDPDLAALWPAVEARHNALFP